MIFNHPNPWNFSNKDEQLISPNKQCRIEYGELFEIAMGAPLGGECFLVYMDNSRLKVSEWAGGPVVWEKDSIRLALPIWTRERNQNIAVVDIAAQTLNIYAATFRVLDLKTLRATLLKAWTAQFIRQFRLFLTQQVKRLKRSHRSSHTSYHHQIRINK